MLAERLQFTLKIVLIVLSFLISGEGKKKGIKEPRSLGVSGKCKPNIMAEYDLTFYGEWTYLKFPKMYPRYRPPAQWSKLVGRSHDASYNMWSVDSYATPPVRSFAEKADSSEYDQEVQAYKGILDTFTAASIPSGAGRSSVHFLADGLRSKLSFVVKIIPSPDWIVGLSSFDLCDKGRWRKKVNVDLFPIDIGTDQGLTFSSPNWPSDPQEKIYQIDVNRPNHTASSFYYPEKKLLPRIAHVELTKVAEFKKKGKTMEISPPVEPNVVYFGDNDMEARDIKSAVVNNETQAVTKKDAGKNDIAALDEASVIDALLVADNMCIVSEWGQWTACSKTCSFGQQERRREIIQRARDRRTYCPLLVEERICGSMKNCQWSHFQLLKRNG
ncbi:hypothetical protein CHS0354_006343 [Potamilus streckersoni]|uniref:Spondin domain-containing protein n=1 Tax=Potamilus streckersoni TaxID=2493646 RepID=A0AAE0SV44_9BIVA|nr:hypothetical protein CHS0354_006343 [Potamilus streckersoni]